MSVYCKKPYIHQGYAFGCGQCIPCLSNRRRVWTHRLMLESQLHEHSSFVTLTYEDEYLPEGSNLCPRDLQLFIKRLRKRDGNARYRYYGVGEYGSLTARPHYHLAVYGYRSCDFGVTRTQRRFCCERCATLSEVWGKGKVYLGQLEPKSACYIAGYLGKGKNSVRRGKLAGRVPEFARMSNRPGIGCDMMDEVASTLLEHGLALELADVPHELRHGTVRMPLGSYLRKKLRERIGRDAQAPKEAYEKMDEKMRPLREYAKVNKAGSYEDTLRGVIQDVGKGRRLQIESRFRNKRDML